MSGPTPSTTASGPPERSESGLGIRTAVVVTAIGLAASVLLRIVSLSTSNADQVADTTLRRALVMTLAFYVVLGLALGAFVLRRRVMLTWVRTDVVDALCLGLPLGLAGGLLGVAVNSAGAGHLASDPNVELLVGGGGALRVGLAFITTAMLAPLFEETLFRGVLGGSLLARGRGVATWGSAVAFSAWHLNASAIRYYLFMGALFAALWLKRGLIASMAAHAAFNGVLTLAAVVATSGAGHPVSLGQLSLSIPGGWHESSTAGSGNRLYVTGPGGAALLVTERQTDHPMTEEEITGSMRSVPEFAAQAASAHPVPLGSGTGITFDLTVAGQPAHLVDIPAATSVFRVVLVTSGSPAAERSWLPLLRSLHVHG